MKEKSFDKIIEGGEQKESIMTKVVSRFRRHADPEKDPKTGLSLDTLKESGIEQAELIGCEAKKQGRADKIKKGFHSPKNRAWETLIYLLNGAGRDLIRVYKKSELDTMTVPENQKAEMQWKDKEKGIKRNYDEVVDYCLNHHDNQQQMEKIAHRLAWRVNVAQRTPHFLRPGSDVEMESTTHGPIQEAFLQKVMITKDEQGNKKTGFESVSEMGGAFKPGEGFEVETVLDENGQQQDKMFAYRLDEKGTKVENRQELEVDWDEIKHLGELYRQEKVTEQKEKMKAKKFQELK